MQYHVAFKCLIFMVFTELTNYMKIKHPQKCEWWLIYSWQKWKKMKSVMLNASL